MAVMATLANFCPQKFVCHLNSWWPMPSFQATQFEQKCVGNSFLYGLLLLVSIFETAVTRHRSCHLTLAGYIGPRNEQYTVRSAHLLRFCKEREYIKNSVAASTVF